MAASTASSLAVEGLSTSVGVSSNAISGASNVSSGRPPKVAQGQYRIVAQARTGEQAVLDLEPLEQAQAQPQAQAQAWALRLPQTVAAQQALQPGGVLDVRTQPYGLSIAMHGQAQPFYLVLHDTWAHGLQARPLER